MGKINECLKKTFIIFNSVFLGFGFMMIFGLIKASIRSHKEISLVEGQALIWFGVFTICVLAISCLGIYVGKSENYLLLKVFTGFMVVGLIIMLIFGIIVVVERNKVKSSFTSTSSEYTKLLMDDNEFRSALHEIQRSVKCCGLTSAADWGDEIPRSCACGYYGSGCTSRPQVATGPDEIYAQTCGVFIFETMDYEFKIAMGLFFGLAVIALLGLLVSFLMIYQIKRHDSSGSASISMKGF
ncbi:tetraspanin-8-like [Scomber japonicus]|uniref:tetraspanin-8-like n=1 Tax=Scomber japonicus TaxID=13676 RepID=UPI002304DDCE|nr:tetraspanin-8-like [Scomber japonicus]